MKADMIKERPDYELYKQNDIVSFYHLQMPRWLIEDGRYMRLSIEAKFAYTLLLNRFQLSKLNGWINENGEVFIIYTRKELAKHLNASEKRASAAMSELKEYELIWERRRGRGFANHIYLANVKISIDDSLKPNNGPLDQPETYVDINDEDESEGAELRHDETTVLGKDEQKNESAIFTSSEDSSSENGCFLTPVSKMAARDTPEKDFKNLQSGGSKHAEKPSQEPTKCPPNYKDFRFEKQINNQSQSMSSQNNVCMNGQDGRTDTYIIKELIAQAELEVLSDSEASVIRDAIERLYFMQSIKIGNAVYPKESIRSNLWRLNALIAEDTINRIAQNTTSKIRNSSAYVVAVLFNTIMESGSDLVVDPYLNSLRSSLKTVPVSIGGG